MPNNLENSSEVPHEDVARIIADSLFDKICNSDTGILKKLKEEPIPSRHLLIESFVIPRIIPYFKDKKCEYAQQYYYKYVRDALHARLQLEKGVKLSWLKIKK